MKWRSLMRTAAPLSRLCADPGCRVPSEIARWVCSPVCWSSPPALIEDRESQKPRADITVAQRGDARTRCERGSGMGATRPTASARDLVVRQGWAELCGLAPLCGNANAPASAARQCQRASQAPRVSLASWLLRRGPCPAQSPQPARLQPAAARSISASFIHLSFPHPKLSRDILFPIQPLLSSLLARLNQTTQETVLPCLPRPLR